ncbi:dipeptide/oligopeptide/nickel ABC transporter permease/ATP-binding protein [Leucobacter sp. BZR 635]
MTDPVLSVEGLSISAAGTALVRDVSFHVAPGEVVGVVGESGSGKTLTSLAIAQLLPRGVEAQSQKLELAGRELSTLSEHERRFHLGTKLSMVFQDPMSSLNPAMRIGAQLIEGSLAHGRLSRSEARDRALQALTDVHIPRPERVLRQHPHSLSGGMRQRVMIAMALMQQPELIIADEPTTALDVTVQAQVMTILSNVNREHGTAILMVSHNIALLSEICDRVLVMFRGDLVDVLSTDELLAGKGHPYTQMLVRAVPDLATDRDRPLATIDDLQHTNEVNAHGTGI